MRKILNILAILVVGGVAAVYFLLGPSFLIGGPKSSAIIDISRAVMVATAATPAQADLAKAAKITPKGLCSHQEDDSYACIVEVEVTGAAPTTLIAVLKKMSGGAWVAAE
ncbi:hypothetical protein GCM10010873_24750 [Cypionkella aquatica]|uniref:Uncharacterized protein n=1 Tax=Cypionkella aquatica TaxID=1756042 RepID=A0AA37X4J0_9RHOB|nr:hypothetical protein [Cypionkella aquatica]GLS87501.1 hypothetical protein GCM10010873_24750 [Cypionkella aquatica]